MKGWISTGEDLPRPNQWVLAWDQSNKTTQKAYYYGVHDFRVPDDSCSGGWRGVLASHWMPLPQPPGCKKTVAFPVGYNFALSPFATGFEE